MVQGSFELFGLTPAETAHPGIAIAAARAGGIGVLDLEFCRDDKLAADNFRRLAEATDARIGLRVTLARAELAEQLLATVADRPLTLILAGAVEQQTQLSTRIVAADHYTVLAEVTDVAMAAAIAFTHHGLIARGHEAGGWVGADTSYILAQKLLGNSGEPALPIYVQGGIGIHSAAACRAMGAGGVVFDDQLLLLAESPLTPAQQAELARLNGAETRLYGDLVDQPCRVYSRPGTAALKAADEDGRRCEGGELPVIDWKAQQDMRLSWGGGADSLLPLGQGIGMAATYKTQYRSVGCFFQAVRRASLKHIESAATTHFLGAGGPLAQSHGTRYPLAQGPMTRVSDSAEFAYEVSRNGALPFLALALMRGPQVLEMLQQTQKLMTQDGQNLPWGVGLLGFVPQSLREEQIAAVWQCKPSFALIAGGRPDQAAHFEQEGIPTYIHAPAPALLKMYIEQGAKRFVFEGRECGGHIGPLASFPLWEQMIEVLLSEVKPGTESGYHLLFAGGIHDAKSGAMLAALTAPLAARGMKVGALMGTAYLFTQEIVSSGAVVEGFQQQAIACDKTVNFDTGPGHSTRCVDTPFFREFRDKRAELLRAGTSADELRDVLEDMNMGRMRIASKGLNRDASGAIVSVSVEDQYKDGMFMIGQVATMRHAPLSIAELHHETTDGAMALLTSQVSSRLKRAVEARPAEVAIVGIGTLLPKAQAAEKLWENLIDQVCVIGEVPKDRWDWKLYFDADRRARDKVYSRWGGFLDEVAFDPISYGIPPKSMKSIDPMQLLTLEVTRRALADAGMGDGDFDRENTSVILGAGGGLGDLGTQYAVRAEIPRFVENPDATVWERLPEWTEESFAGTLLNVAAGRVTNRLDFGGLNFTIDAACASSLAAISIAVNELEAGRTNVAVAGGIDTVQSPFGFLCFSKTQALSPDGKPRTFDNQANGIAISEGLAVVVLKRLADAERDGDRIYAVIKAAAGSSDGKALGMTAPRPEGQKLALKRAYARAGFSPATLGMAEAHGTGTPVGDRAEARTITESLSAEGAAPKTVAIGSIKTLLGHTKASAGVSGLIKVALSLYHRTLPAHYGVSSPIDSIADANSPVYLLKEARPWLAHPDHPRRGGVSAFGFGGTNFHAVLEEYRGAYASSAPAGAARWPSELLVFRAKDEATLAADVGRVVSALRLGSNLKLRDLAYSLAVQAESRAGATLCLALVAKDLTGLLADLEAAVGSLAGNGKPLPQAARLGRNLPATAPPIAFLFPGQGAQSVNMGRETAVYVDELREALEFADVSLRADFPELLSRTMYPPAAFDVDAESAQTRALTDTRVAQPAIGALALGYLRFADRLGLAAIAAAGHSYGEYAALHAAGVLSAADFLRLSTVRGRCMADAARSSEPGAMAAIQAKREVVMQAIGSHPGVKLANHNAPEQAVISGPAAGVEAAAKKLESQGLRVTRLAVSGAFHTELVAGAQLGLSAAIQSTTIGAPRFPVYSNTTAQPYPTDAEGIRQTLDRHLLNSVEFVAEIEAMYAAGCRVFVELGPKGVCANMAKATLAGRDAVALSLDGAGGGLRGLLLGLADLCAAGVQPAITRLFDARDAQLLDLGKLADLVQPVAPPKHAWWISGGCSRPLDDPQMRTGSVPALDLATSEAAKQKARAAVVTPVAIPAVTAAAATAPVVVPAAAPMPSSSALGSDALAAYQQTMRQFLSLQERVIQQFLGGASATGAVATPAMPAIPVMPAIPTALPVPTSAVPPPVATPAPAPARPAAAMAPATPIVSAAVAMPAFNAEARLLEIVAERTGYPADMLGLDQDLEAELGIDSIKRVEILGAFQKQLPAAAGDAMQGGMERYTRAKTLRAVLEATQADLAKLGTTAPMAAVVSVAPAVVVAAPAASMDRAALQDQLLAIVADRTGYPTDMLGLDQDLEAELGIDSIKRVEILGALQKALPTVAGDAMQAGMERFTKARTLAAILDTATSLIPTTIATAAVPTVAIPVSIATTAAAPVLDRAQLQTQLLEIVAERTGYPTDMLGLDQDLEAELGIDSIKRVEILGALQKSLPASAGDAMQGGMERFTKARTLAAIVDAAETLMPAVSARSVAIAASPAMAARAPAPALDRASLQRQLLEIVAERTGYPTDMLGLDQDLEAELTLAAILDAAMALAPATPVSATSLPAAPIPPVTAPVLDRSSLQRQLLEIVAERTGYPTDMLGLDQDLEAELGIDSIKRVEILGALQKTLPVATGEAMQAGMERFTKARTLSAILDAAGSLGATASAAATSTPMTAAAVALPTAVTDAAAPLPRYVPRARPAPLSAARHALKGVYVITRDDQGVAERLADRIVGTGAKAVVIDAATAADPAAAQALFAQLRTSQGSIGGIAHLAPLGADAATSMATWKSQTATQAKALFWLLQSASTEFSSGPAVALAASRFGGSLGRNAEGPTAAAAGAAVGLFNCATAEWPSLRARLVDFGSETSADAMADALLDELTVDDARTEIGYAPAASGIERIAFVHVSEAVSDNPFAPHLEPAGDWVALITGGARGITAEIAEELIRPGMRLVLVGRTPLASNEGADTVQLDGQELKKKLLDRALAAGRRPTPVELEREVKAVLADREIRDNLLRLTVRGASVDYRSCDVRDETAFGALIDEVYAVYGRIDAVIHGAGVIEDRRIADKTAESFDRVYDTKVDSAFVLTQKLRPDSLRLLAFFTSVAGRFGNVGQGDYGAANETLNRLGWQLHHRWPGVRVMSINWGPWDAGMATEQVKAGFRSRGIEPIPVAAGRRWFIDELAYGPRNDVELVAGAGPWEQVRSMPGALAETAITAVHASHALIRNPLRIGVGGAVTLECRLSLDSDPYLADHVMDGKPVLPAAGALEYMAQFVAAGWPEWQIAEMRDVRALSGIVLEGDAERALILKARSSTHSEPGVQAVTVEILDPNRKAPCYRATAILMERLPDAPPASASTLVDASSLNALQAYADYLFHGERFKLVSAIGGIGVDGIDATVTPSSPRLFLGAQVNGSRWLFDPGLVDTAPQLAIVWSRVNRGMTALPSRFGRVARYGTGPLSGPLSLALRVKPAPHEAALIYDVQIVDADGQVRVEIIDAEGTMSAALNRLVGAS